MSNLIGKAVIFYDEMNRIERKGIIYDSVIIDKSTAYVIHARLTEAEKIKDHELKRIFPIVVVSPCRLLSFIN